MEKDSALYQLMDTRMHSVMNGIVSSDGEYQAILRRSDIYSGELDRMDLSKEIRLLIDRYVSEQNALGSRFGMLAYLLGFSDCKAMFLGKCLPTEVREVTFSDLALHEERQLYTVDKYFQDEEAEPSYQMAGKEITPKLLLEAIRALPEERRKIVLLYYFEGLTDIEIGKQLNISRSTVQYRRTSSFEQLKKYLEENADEWVEW